MDEESNVCDLCGGTGVVQDYVFSEEAKVMVSDGERKCLCKIEEDFEDYSPELD